MRGLNNKSKLEQLFLIFVLCLGCFGVLCMTGCGGGKSCEMVKCGDADEDGFTGKGISVPGCGGLLSSGKGCDSCLWAQSMKFVDGSMDSSDPDDETGSSDSFKATGCDIRYYGKGCLGCGQRQKSCYFGYIKNTTAGDKTKGFFYGSSDSKEKFIGCSNGCGGCINSDGAGAFVMYTLEEEMDVD